MWRPAEQRHLTFVMKEPVKVAPTNVDDVFSDRLVMAGEVPSLRVRRRWSHHRKLVNVCMTLRASESVWWGFRTQAICYLPLQKAHAAKRRNRTGA